jgi:hypothetical protein
VNGVRALIASTMPEVWQIIHSGVVEEGKVDDVSLVFHYLVLHEEVRIGRIPMSRSGGQRCQKD